MTKRAIGLLGTGSYVPDRMVTNKEIATLLPGATPELIMHKTAISAPKVPSTGLVGVFR